MYLSRSGFRHNKKFMTLCRGGRTVYIKIMRSTHGALSDARYYAMRNDGDFFYITMIDENRCYVEDSYSPNKHKSRFWH